VPKFQTRLFVGATFSVAFAAGPVLAGSPVVEISQAMAKGGVESGIGATRIIVDGAGTDRYDKVVNADLDFWVNVSGSTPEHNSQFDGLEIHAANAVLNYTSPPAGNKTYKLSSPYRDPRMPGVANQTFSPIARCNAEIANRSGAARTAFIKEGGTVRAIDAYPLSATAHWQLWPGGIGFKEEYRRDFRAEARADAIIECRPLDRPKPRTETHTQGAPSHHGQKMQPTLQAVSFKAEPHQIETVGKQQCPTHIRLYGFVQVRRSFNGKMIFFGPHFLSPITDLAFAEAGQRTVTADYPVKWGSSGGKAAAGLMKQLVLLKMNVANAEGKVLETVERGIQLSCRPTRTPPPS
jgi:hypothetical protein